MVEDDALLKENKRDLKIKVIGNYVHESVPISDNEVRVPVLVLTKGEDAHSCRTTTPSFVPGLLRTPKWRRKTVSPTTKSSPE